jgi:hypothetical protein
MTRPFLLDWCLLVELRLRGGNNLNWYMLELESWFLLSLTCLSWILPSYIVIKWGLYCANLCLFTWIMRPMIGLPGVSG